MLEKILTSQFVLKKDPCFFFREHSGFQHGLGLHPFSKNRIFCALSLWPSYHAASGSGMHGPYMTGHVDNRHIRDGFCAEHSLTLT